MSDGEFEADQRGLPNHNHGTHHNNNRPLHELRVGLRRWWDSGLDVDDQRLRGLREHLRRAFVHADRMLSRERLPGEHALRTDHDHDIYDIHLDYDDFHNHQYDHDFIHNNNRCDNHNDGRNDDHNRRDNHNHGSVHDNNRWRLLRRMPWKRDVAMRTARRRCSPRSGAGVRQSGRRVHIESAVLYVRRDRNDLIRR